MVTTTIERGAGAVERYRRHKEKYRRYKERISKKGRKIVEVTEVDERPDTSDAEYGATLDTKEVDEAQTKFREGEEWQKSKTTAAASTEKPHTPRSRHIRPCLCDLTASAKKRISEYRSQKSTLYNKLVLRKAEIEAEVQRKRLEALERERERAEQQEFFEDEYELTASGTKKRKKRSARRVSMVSLGVRTIIKWKNEPKIKVVLNRTWHLRRYNTHYCGAVNRLLPPIEVVDYKKEPLVPVRKTNAYGLRLHFNDIYKKVLSALEDKRQPFVLNVVT